jgi:hypothetical protein
LSAPGNKKYLVVTNAAGGVTIQERDIESASAQASDIPANQFRVIVDTSETDKFSLKIGNSSDTIISGLNVEYNTGFSPHFSVRNTADNSVYCFDITPPTDETLGAGTTTLIKHRDSKYLAIEGTSAVLKDYWTSGYSLTQLQERLMFTWTDLTPISASTIPGNTQEINRWNLRESLAASVVSLPNSAGSTLTVGANASLNEGWALTGRSPSTDVGGALIFVRDGVIRGFANVLQNSDNVTFIPSSNIPTDSWNKAWTCVKCTSIVGGMCVA